MLAYASYTDVGTRKSVNQDNHYVAVANTDDGDVGFAVVCDGVGGLSSGELASIIVVERFSKWFEGECADWLASCTTAGFVDSAPLRATWSQMLAELNKAIYEHGQESGAPLGTTFTGVLTYKGRYFAGHVGDCRFYIVHGGACKQVTADQTYVAREVARGNITPEEAAVHPKRNVLLQAVGTQGAVQPAFYSGVIEQDCALVVCCDGLYRRTGAQGIAEAFATLEGDLHDVLLERCRMLAETAMSRGETDNITIASIACIGEHSGFSADARAVFDGAGAEDEADDCPTDRIVLEEGVDS